MANQIDTLTQLREEIAKMRKTTGIKGILGTEHRDGVVNEGYNYALSDVLHLIDSKLEVIPPRRERRRPNNY